MLSFYGEGEGYCGGKWSGDVVWWRGVGNLKTYCCMPDLNLTPKFKYSTLLCFNLIEILNIYRPTISFHDNHQTFQGWNPTTTIKITILKMRFNYLQK